MRLRDFLTSIVQPNMQLALENPDDERHGINAILTIDALVGQLYEAMLTSNHPDVAGVKRAHLAALALVQVAVLAVAAQRLDVVVDADESGLPDRAEGVPPRRRDVERQQHGREDEAEQEEVDESDDPVSQGGLSGGQAV